MTALSILFLYVLPAIGRWKIFEKAGVGGWVALVPGLSWLGTLKLLGRSYLWILCFIFFYPVTRVVASVLVAWQFGKSWLYGLGLAFAPFVFEPHLGLSDARYQRPLP
jgi:signal peptidase I